MHLPHMINHLVLPRKPILPPPMTTRELASHALQRLRVVHDLDVALEIGVSGEVACGRALGVEADVVLAGGFLLAEGVCWVRGVGGWGRDLRAGGRFGGVVLGW